MLLNKMITSILPEKHTHIIIKRGLLLAINLNLLEYLFKNNYPQNYIISLLVIIFRNAAKITLLKQRQNCHLRLQHIN